MALLASVTIVPCTGAPRCSRTWPCHRKMQQVGSCPFHFQTEGKRISKQAPKCFKWGLQAPCWDVLALAELLGTDTQMDAWTAASPPRQEPPSAPGCFASLSASNSEGGRGQNAHRAPGTQEGPGRSILIPKRGILGAKTLCLGGGWGSLQ